MKKEDAINKLISYIKGVYDGVNNKISPNIYRGHLRSISTDIEDGIALFISNIMPEGYKVFLDPSIHVDGANNRPDLLVVNDKNETVAMIEVKANMGYCRNAKDVIDNIVRNDEKFSKLGSLYCEFSRETSQTISYGDNVKLFLIALTDKNCSDKHHKANKDYAAKTKVHQYNLFSGWYGNLIPCEIEKFANDILS